MQSQLINGKQYLYDRERLHNINISTTVSDRGAVSKMLTISPYPDKLTGDSDLDGFFGWPAIAYYYYPLFSFFGSVVVTFKLLSNAL